MGTKILFIHHDQETLNWVQNVFEEWDYEIIVETTCEAGIESLTNSNIDGLLLDLDELEFEGLKILTYLREQPIPIPSIVIGSNGTEHLLIAALTKGAQDFLIKPISVDEMYDKCTRLFG